MTLRGATTGQRETAFDDDWIVLRRAGGPRVASLEGVHVARTLRKALMSAYGPDVPEILSGHRTSGQPSEHAHLAYVPLPWVGETAADGGIQGVALVLPRRATNEERFAVYRALDSWGRNAAQGGAKPRSLPVHLGKTGVLLLERIEGERERNGDARGEGQEAASMLDAATWCEGSTTWASATPVALDRNPGELRSPDPGKAASARAEAEAIIALACERIRLPRPARVTVELGVPFAGAEDARRFPAFAAGNPPVQRLLAHAKLVFDGAVRGPILLGAGRYFGLGMFRPLRG